MKTPHRATIVGALAVSVLLPTAGPAQEVDWGHVRVTDDVLDAWIMSVLDHRIATIFAEAGPDLEGEDADPKDTVIALRALADDATLTDLVRLYGFESARAWADATTRISSGVMCGIISSLSADFAPTEGPAGAAYRREVDKQLEKAREALGQISEAEEQLIIDRLDDLRRCRIGEPPASTPALELEGLQRWIACDRDEKVGAVLDELGAQLREGPAALKQLILARSVDPDIDAAVRAQGFGGGNEWAQVTMQVLGSVLEAGIHLKLNELDAQAAEHTPEEFAQQLDGHFANIAELHLAFGLRPASDIDLAGKYRESIFKALGSADAGGGEQV